MNDLLLVLMLINAFVLAVLGTGAVIIWLKGGSK